MIKHPFPNYLAYKYAELFNKLLAVIVLKCLHLIQCMYMCKLTLSPTYELTLISTERAIVTAQRSFELIPPCWILNFFLFTIQCQYFQHSPTYLPLSLLLKGAQLPTRGVTLKGVMFSHIGKCITESIHFSYIAGDKASREPNGQVSFNFRQWLWVTV